MSTTSEVDAPGHVIARFSARLHEVLGAPRCSGVVDDRPGAAHGSGEAQPRRGTDRCAATAGAGGCRPRSRVGRVGCDLDGGLAGAPDPAGALGRSRRCPLAVQLEGTYSTTREALADGLVDRGQAQVIVRAVEALPKSAGAAVRELAEKHLVALAGEHDEKALKVLGRRVFEVMDPESADAEDGRRLAAEEASAARATYLHLFDNGDGTHTRRFKVASLHAAMLKKMLNALLAPGTSLPPPGPTPPTSTPPGPTPSTRIPLRTRRHPTRPEQPGAGVLRAARAGSRRPVPQGRRVAATVVVLLD